MTCPDCGSEDTRASKRFRSGDVFQRLRGRGAFRCRHCNTRFYGAEPAAPGSIWTLVANGNLGATSRIRAQTRRRLTHWMILAGVFGFASLCFGCFCARSFRNEAPPCAGTQCRPTMRAQTASPRSTDSDLSGKRKRGFDWNQDGTFCWSPSSCTRVMYSSASIMNIQPETAGRGNG